MGDQKKDSVPKSAAASMPPNPSPAESEAEEVIAIQLVTGRKSLQVRYDAKSTINSRKQLYLNPWTTREARTLFGGELGRVIPGADLNSGKIYLILTSADDPRGKDLTYHDSGNTATISLTDAVLMIQLSIPAGRVAKIPTEVKMIKALVDGQQSEVPAIVLDVKNRKFEARSVAAKKEESEATSKPEGLDRGEQGHAASELADEE